MQGIDPFAIPAGMNNPLYPMAGYDNSRELDHDMSMMKEMYPLLVRQILLEIENECDKLEYAGSFMFDEIPDKTLILMLTDKIYEKVAPAFSDESSLISAEFHDRGHDKGHRPPGHYPPSHCSDRNPDCHPDGSPNWLSGLINVLLCGEMCDRRRRYRRRNHMFIF